VPPEVEARFPKGALDAIVRDLSPEGIAVGKLYKVALLSFGAERGRGLGGGLSGLDDILATHFKVAWPTPLPSPQ